MILELLRIRSTPSLPSLPSPLWPEVVSPDTVLSMGQIELNCVLMPRQWSGRPGFNPMSSHTKDFKKWYLIPPCLTLSNISYVSRVKWSIPGKGVAPSPAPRYCSYWKGSLMVALDYGRQLYFICIKMELALNNPQWLICHETKPNQVIRIWWEYLTNRITNVE